MYKNKKILCVIPARGGSKGLARKNVKKLLGKPLIAYTIEQAKKSKYIDRIIVSTEDKVIARISRKYGAEVPFLRPGILASDSAGTIDVLLHAMEWMEKVERYQFDILVLLHATTPLRGARDIDNCIKLLFKKNASNIFSVTEAHRNPYFNMVELKKSKVALVKKGNFVSRQEAPKVFDTNSSIYVWWKDGLRKGKSVFLKHTAIYFMPKKRSIDIDDGIDFKLAELLMKEKVMHVRKEEITNNK